MKRWLTGMSLLAVISAGAVTGCATTANNQASNSGNVQSNTAGNTTPYTPPSNSANTAGNGNTTASNTASKTMTNAQMATVAKDVVSRYLQSHNDKTAAAYKVDISQILIPGLASAVQASAQSGTDYNHPIKSSTVDITKIQPINQTMFQAQAKVNVQFVDGTNENTVYHVVLSQDQSSNQWLIRSIG